MALNLFFLVIFCILIVLFFYYLLRKSKSKKKIIIKQSVQSTQPDLNPSKYKVISENFASIDSIGSISLANSNSENLNKLPDVHNLINLIKKEFVEESYRFNIAGLPVTTKNASRENANKKYLKHVSNAINQWNNLFSLNQIKVKSIYPLIISETDSEFVLKANVKIIYNEKPVYLQVEFYGKIEKTDDILNKGKDCYILQLLSARLIPAKSYKSKVQSSEFMTMEDQLAYVEKVNEMHENE